MRVYIAAPWVRRPEAIAIGEQFKAAGHELTSRWFYHETSPGGDPMDATGLTSPLSNIQHQANEDIADVRRADVLVVLNLQKSEGKAVETGIAIAAGIPVISVGPRSNIFQALGKEVATVEEALDVLCSYVVRMRPSAA
jgi:nucleoside 2-deoxyribosyltransferase